MKSREWELDTQYISPKTPAQPYQPIKRKKRKVKQQKIKSGACSLVQQKNIGFALKARQPQTMKYRVSKIVPKRWREGNKWHAVLRGSAARRHISIPMCDRSVAILYNMLYKIRCNSMHHLYAALPVPCVLDTRLYSYALPRCRTSEYRRTFLSMGCFCGAWVFWLIGCLSLSHNLNCITDLFK